MTASLCRGEHGQPVWGVGKPDDRTRCFTCGAKATRTFPDGSPAFDCGPHRPVLGCGCPVRQSK